MTPKENDLLKINGMSEQGLKNTLADLDRINRGANSASTIWYGEHYNTIDDSHWWDTFSSLMTSKHETSISSLNDDNRNDEAEIEILEQASNIDPNDIKHYSDQYDFYFKKYKEASSRGLDELAENYRQLAYQAKHQLLLLLKIVDDADGIVKRDKQLLDIVGHNPIMEIAGGIIDATSTGASAGAVAGSWATSVGSVAGAIVGAVAGLAYGLYDNFDAGKFDIDRSAYTEPLSNDKNVNYQNSIKTRQSYKDYRAKQIQDEQSDLFWWQTEYPVSNYYRSMEDEISKKSLFDDFSGYLYYNLPGIIGSSFSDTKDMGLLVTNSYGLTKLAKKLPKGKGAVRALAFFEALRNGWQQSLNENHAEASETSTKKALSEIEKNKSLSQEMLSNARDVAINLYGLSKNEASRLIDGETAFMMYQGGVGGLNPRKLNNGYSYYKAARLLSDIGADTQFERDMVATASGDLLESALMVTPIGALANKSKVIGRAVIGAGIGASAASAAGFGTPGLIIGGAFGGLAGQVGPARRLWRGTMRKVLAIEDKILPSLLKQIMFDKAVHAAAAFGTTSLAEAAEEGTQYLNSLDAEKMLNLADDELGLRNMKNLFVNDLKKRGEVFNAVLNLFGLTESPYQDDHEFWANWKGGLILGGLMTGSMVSLREAVGAKKAYNAAKFVSDEILSSAVANRTASQDAILKGAAFAKYGFNKDADQIIDIINRAKEKNHNRKDTPYSDKDFDDLAEQANRIISKINYKPIQQRLKDLGYELGSEEANYAVAVNDYYLQKTRQNKREEDIDLAQRIKLMNDPALMLALNDLAGEETVADEWIDGDKFVYRERQEDGTVVERQLSKREAYLKKHQNAAQAIAIAQLLNDLQGVRDLLQWAEDKGIAFNRSQVDRSISILRDNYDLLLSDVELYSGEVISREAPYEDQINVLRGYLLDQESGIKLAELYRNSTLRMLNLTIYTNIIRSLALDTNTDYKNDEVVRTSKNMTKRFIDNVQKNKQLLEIVDYNIENDFQNAAPSEEQININSGELSASPEEEPVEQPTEISQEEDEDEQDYPKEGFVSNLIKKVKDLYKRITSRNDTLTEEEPDEEEFLDEPVEEPVEDEVAEQPEEPLTEELVEEPQPEEVEQSYDEAPVEDQLLEQNPVEQPINDENSVLEAPENTDQYNDVPLEDQESAVIVEEEAGSSEEVGDSDSNNEGQDSNKPVNNQQETINKLVTSVEKAPVKLIEGWYLSEDGKIIPSDKMYMANPVETPRRDANNSVKYKLTAAQIRFNVHRYLNSKKDSLLKLKQYVGQILNTSDVSIIDPIANALLNGDQNAVKLLITQANPILFRSYYVNEFFRNAARSILNGFPVQRPDYIDEDAFKRFCREVILYKNRMQTIYGYRFVTNVSPVITTINGDLVVGDPDFVAVDEAGNAHVVDIYTINNDSYKKVQGSAETYKIDLSNTKNLFSQQEERSALVDILSKSLLDGHGVQASSTVLLPIVVDGYTSVHRLYLGKLLPIIPNNDNLSKYANLEDQLEELKMLLEKANEKAAKVVDDVNKTIEQLREYRRKYKLFGPRLRKSSKYKAEDEPKSIAEAYALLDKALNIIQSRQKYYSDHLAKEVALMNKADEKEAREGNKTELLKQIEEINSIADESRSHGIQIEIIDGEQIINNSDIITNGVFKARLDHSQTGDPFVRYYLEYDEKVYNIRITPNRKGQRKINHPVYTRKMAAISALLDKHPDLVITFDANREFITYYEKASFSPTRINDKEGIITDNDVNNLGVLQDDGKIVDIGFYDARTGVILTGSNSSSASLGYAQEGNYRQNNLFLVIKQKHQEISSAKERVVTVPLIESKFDAKLAAFIAECYRTIARGRRSAQEDSGRDAAIANQMLHFFVGRRIIYDKANQEHPGIVYVKGESVRLNGQDFYLFDDKQYKDFIKELQKCTIMPSWTTFNAKLKNLADGTFSLLYDHFSKSEEDFNISLHGIESGFSITKENFNNDTLCLWFTRNGFLYSNWFIQNQASYTIHNILIKSSIEGSAEEELKQSSLKKAEPSQPENTLNTEPEGRMTEEEYKKWLEESGAEEVGEDEEEEEEDYSYVSSKSPSEDDYRKVRNIKTVQDAIQVIGNRYPALAKLMKRALKRIGDVKILFVVSNEYGSVKKVNGVVRTKQGSTKSNKDGSWTVTFYLGNPDIIKTLAHEMVHVFTMGAINKNTNLAKSARSLYLYCLETFTEQEKLLYGFKNFKEFVAEFFTNEEFRQLLLSKKKIQKEIIDSAIDTANSESKNFLDTVVKFFTKIWQKFVVRFDKSLYHQTYRIMSDLLVNPLENAVEENAEDESVTGGYVQRNHATNEKIVLLHCKDRQQLRHAVDAIMCEWIKHENITALGKNIDKINFSGEAIVKRLELDTEFAQWYQRTFTYSDKPLIREITKITRPTDESLKTEDNPEGFIFYEKSKIETKEITLKDGTVIKKRVRFKKQYTKLLLPNWNAMTSIFDEFMSDMRFETRKKVEYRNEDLEQDDREEGRNVFGELLTESCLIDPIEKASREVKFWFSTVPYGELKPAEEPGKDPEFVETTDHNEFGFNTFMPFKDVYGKVLYYTANCHTTSDILKKFKTLSVTGPDKAMFFYLYKSLNDLISKRWVAKLDDKLKSNKTQNEEGLFFDANIDSTVIKIIRSLRLQQNNFIWANTKTNTEKDGTKTKDITIRTTIYQKQAIQTIQNWCDQLATGLTGVIKYDPKLSKYVYQNRSNQDIFNKIYLDLFVGKNSFITAYNKYRQQKPEDVELNWRYLKEPVKFSKITSDDVKTYLHNALLELGVDVRQEVIDQWIQLVITNNPTVSNEMDALYLILSDQHSNYRPANFFSRLAESSSNLTQDSIAMAFNSGFIKQLANLQNEYNLKTQSLMAVAAHNNQYYIVSDSNYVNDIADIINKNDTNDSYIQMLQEDSFAQGSVVVENLGKIDLSVATFVGMKTDNIGDQGRDYFEIELDEDVVSKLELLHEGYMISPTQSDKKTYHTIFGIPLVGMMRGKKTNTDCYLANYRTGSISITDNVILDRFIAYFRSERNAVEKAIDAYESDFYKNNPGKKIANYSDGNGMYFSSFNCLPLANGEKIFLNKRGKNNIPGITKTVQENGKIRLSLSSHTQENPRQIVLEPQGNNKYYAHIRIWDGDHIPGKISDEDKLKLYDALYNELPDGAEILVPQSGEGNYATRGTIAALQKIARDTKFKKGSSGTVQYKDKDGSIKTFETTSFIKKDNGPRKNLLLADQYFFNQDIKVQYEIMRRILLERAQEDLLKVEELGLIKRNQNGSYENVGLDHATIQEMAENINHYTFGEDHVLKDHVDNETGEKHAGPRKEFCISSAIQEYVIDCSIKHMMSMQEYQRLFSGSKSFYKWKRNGLYVTDISVDYTKRRGGDISTGGVNITDIDPIEGMEELGTYRCLEVLDYLVESTTLDLQALIQLFEGSEFVSVAYSILNEDTSSLNTTKKTKLDKSKCEQIITERYGADFVNVLKNKARANAMQYFREISSKEDPINVADGATYITDRFCEKLLREEGKWDDDMKYAFEVLRGEHGEDVLSEKGRDLYKSILDVVIGTQKYTATGFRKSDDGKGGTLMTPYYNKTALFPIFEQIAYGRMKQFLDAMRKNNVDVIMMTSAVKNGSQGAITIEQLLSNQDYSDHSYVQELRFLRKQLNTDPNEREDMNLGTQTIKIALSNLRMDDMYINPITGKEVSGRELYNNIMRCYNILADIGFEQVMLRFCRKDANGNVAFTNINLGGEGHMSVPDIDEKALSIFLHEELMSRDANDNMFDAIGYDEEKDRLNAPISAISQSGWIDSIIGAFIGKTIIDTRSPGSAYIQRSVFCMEGEGFKTLNNGEDLKLTNEDGSMDAVVSIDFFKDIIPDYENKTFEESRDWLIKHNLVGSNAKTYTISYRIPTQAQSSINPLKFVDVIPIVRDTIILPKDFTKLTGSDFDIDKLFLSRLNINTDVTNNDDMFTFYDSDELDKDVLLDTLQKGFVNKLFSLYLTLLMDKNSANTKWRPIDADTELWKEVHKDLYPSSSDPIESMSQDTIAYQTKQKNNFVVGKIGIGPYALANNNHIYTMLYGIVLDTDLQNLGEDNLNMGSLCRDRDIYGNSIMSWLSGGINAHVDIAKDPFVTELNINKYTYNISIFLLRAGFGRNALWFLNQPVVKELARRQNNVTGQYLKNNNKDQFEAQHDVLEQYKKELLEQIPSDVLDLESKFGNSEIIRTALGRNLTIRDLVGDLSELAKQIRFSDKVSGFSDEDKASIIGDIKLAYRVELEKPYMDDMVLTDKSKSMIYQQAKYKGSDNAEQNGTMHPALQRYMSVVIFDKINSGEAKTTSDITKFAKIDTKKHGSTAAAQMDYKHLYDKFVAKALTSEKIHGDVAGYFGLKSDSLNTDVIGFDSCVNLTRIIRERPFEDVKILDYTGVKAIGDGLYISQRNNVDITEAGYIDYSRVVNNGSFINNKTYKAINALLSIIKNDSVEGTFGFELIWRTIKNDFGKGSLTDDQQAKLRSTILGAIKNIWAIRTMRQHGIDPITLFKDGENTSSLAHELVKLKTKRTSYIDSEGKKRFGTVLNKYKDNKLLNTLFDAHSTDEYTETDKLIEILDFIKVHVPFTEDTKKANDYIHAWEDLYHDEITKDFAVKLMFYSLLVSNDQGGNNLFKYVPFLMLDDYGLFDAERDIIETLNNPEIQFSKYNDTDLFYGEGLINEIVDAVETILCEDFDFSKPYSLELFVERQDRVTGETNMVPDPQYTGFGNVFGHKIFKNNKEETTTRIPYVFIPAKMNSNGTTSISKTLKDFYGNLVNRPYIRVYNPVANYENQQKYLTYKRIGIIQLNEKTVLPIYQLVQSSMYSLGPYKIYNYNREMNISSSLIITSLKKYMLTSPYSIDEINSLIKAAVKQIEDQNDIRLEDPSTLDVAAAPLQVIDSFIELRRKQYESEYRIFNIRRNILSKYENDEYLRIYKDAHDTGKKQMLEDVLFVLDNNLFTQEEKDIAADMKSSIKLMNEYLEQQKANKKQPARNVDPSTYHMHSGGAWGADTMWDYYGKMYGMPDDPLHFSHYYYGSRTPIGNVLISDTEFSEGYNHVLEADQTLDRLDNISEDRKKSIINLLARNWLQVRNSDGVFAIGELKYGKVDGGTGWAVLMAIDSGKPVHVFNLSTEQWFTWDRDKRTWVVESTPKLTRNFAGIGTRSIDRDIETKTASYKKPVKYVGDAKRLAAIDAINAVYRNTFGEPKSKRDLLKNTEDELKRVLGGSYEAIQEVADAISVAVKGVTFEQAIEGLESFFTAEEIAKIKLGLNGNKLEVKSVSRFTDPAFFEKDIIAFLEKNAEKDLSDPTRINAVEIWTKHDGLPIKHILDACKKYRVAPMVSFSITGLGDTSLEKGVLKYSDMLLRVGRLIKNGTLNPTTTTIRIDPILVGVTNLEDIKTIVRTAKKFGIKKFVTSLMQSYGYTVGTADDRKVVSGINEALASEGKTYDWEKYYGTITQQDFEESSVFVREYREWFKKEYGRDASWNECVAAGSQRQIRIVTKSSIGKIHFIPKKEYINEVGDVLRELDSDPDITIQTCSFNVPGMKVSACLDPLIIERIVGVDVTRPDGTYDRDTSRPECMCYGAHSDIFRWNEKKCYSSCAYCYAGHSMDSNFKYYNEDGTLIDRPLTRTEEPSGGISPDVIKTHEGDWTREEALNNPKTLYIFTDNTDRSSGSNPVPDDTWYNGQYGPAEIMFYPNTTAAVVRGLDNARPISTMHFFYKYHGFAHPAYNKSSKALWHDSDVEEFKSVIRSELEHIVEAWNTGKYDTIMFPAGDGLFNTNLSQISKERTPELYKALSDLLKEFGFGKLVPAESSAELAVDPESWSKKEGWSVDYFNREVKPRINEAWLIEYELVPDTPAESLSTSTAGPSLYTYKDGTTIKTPFQLTVEQVNALERIEDFIKGDQNVLTVSGYAGTGKTSVMEIVAEKHRGDRKRDVVFTASTNAASGVLGQKVSKKGFEATTLDKYFKLRLTQKAGAKYYNARNTETAANAEKFDRFGDIVIIDEASMITKDKYDIILAMAKLYDLKIIFLGDIAQLPPVGESVSPVFLNNENLIQLTQVKRTGDNAILKEATNLRLKDGNFSYVSEFNSKGEGVAFTSDINTIFKTIDHFIPELKTDRNALKIIAGTNDKVEYYNNFVRRLLGYDTPIPLVGELMSGYNNWGRVYDPITRSSKYKIVNSETYTVVSVGDPEERTILLPLNYDDDVDTEPVKIKYTPVVLKSSEGLEIEVPYTLFEENAEVLVKIANVIQKLNIQANNAKRSGNRSALRLVLEKISELEKFVFTNRDVNDNAGNTIIKKAVDFGYAITAHKSQGSTYKHIIIDKNNMDSVSKWTESEKQRMYYTAVSRATTTATILTKDTKVFGDPVTKTPSSKNASQQNIPDATMYFSYGKDKRSDIVSDTTFDAILNGERTSTTRYESDKHIDFWRGLKEGDLVRFHSTKEWTKDPDDRSLIVRITKPAVKLSGELQNVTKKVINVSSYEEETKNLSNFAIRPFRTELAKGTPLMNVRSVEHAFLASKAYFALIHGDITNDQFLKFVDYINKKEGKDVKTAGRRIPMSLNTVTEWNKVSDKVLEVMMLKSFLLNEAAASELLSTGNAEFTHNYKNGEPIEPKTPKRFGTLLDKVRSKLRDEQNRKQECK